MTPNDAILFGLHRSSYILHGMTDEFTAADWLHCAVPGSNCAAFTVGHLIAIEHMALGQLNVDRPALPDAGFYDRHNKDSVPGDDHGDTGLLLPLFDAQRNLMIKTVTALTPTEMDRPLEHPVFKNLGQLMALIPVHTTLHCGQISTIRRSLGKPPIF